MATTGIHRRRAPGAGTRERSRGGRRGRGARGDCRRGPRRRRRMDGNRPRTSTATPTEIRTGRGTGGLGAGGEGPQTTSIRIFLATGGIVTQPWAEVVAAAVAAGGKGTTGRPGGMRGGAGTRMIEAGGIGTGTGTIDELGAAVGLRSGSGITIAVRISEGLRPGRDIDRHPTCRKR
jgi:hypothetical protein